MGQVVAVFDDYPKCGYTLDLIYSKIGKQEKYMVTQKHTLCDLVLQLRDFADARDWEQFHSPKNLSMALAVEVSELMEHLQWLTEEQSLSLDDKTLSMVREEIGDIQLYLARLADRLGIDPLEAAADKLKSNAEKYPVSKARGNALKYTEL